MKYTASYHVVCVIERLLGCENWEPSSNLLQTLMDELSPEERKNRELVREKLKEVGEYLALGHETKLICVMTSKTPYQLTPEDKNDLLSKFKLWWGGDQTKHQMTITEFAHLWAVKRGIHPDLF